MDDRRSPREDLGRTDLDVPMPGQGLGVDPEWSERDPERVADEVRRAFEADDELVQRIERDERDERDRRDERNRGGEGAEPGTPASALGVETTADIQSNSGGMGSNEPD